MATGEVKSTGVSVTLTLTQEEAQFIEAVLFGDTWEQADDAIPGLDPVTLWSDVNEILRDGRVPLVRSPED